MRAPKSTKKINGPWSPRGRACAVPRGQGVGGLGPHAGASSGQTGASRRRRLPRPQVRLPEAPLGPERPWTPGGAFQASPPLTHTYGTPEVRFRDRGCKDWGGREANPWGPELQPLSDQHLNLGSAPHLIFAGWGRIELALP